MRFLSNVIQIAALQPLTMTKSKMILPHPQTDFERRHTQNEFFTIFFTEIEPGRLIHCARIAFFARQHPEFHDVVVKVVVSCLDGPHLHSKF